MSEICQFPLCTRKAEKNGYCIGHRIYAGQVVNEEKPNRIAFHSDKRKEQQREYRKIVKEMLKENDKCDINETGCTKKATGLHHKKKRSPATLLDRKYLIRSCDNCNLWVELHPLEAIEKGYSISKHSPVK